MLDFSGTAQKVQLVQHQEHVFSKPLYPIGGTMSCSLRRYMVCYYLATLFVLSLDSNTSGLHVNLLAGQTYIGGAGHDSMIGCSIWLYRFHLFHHWEHGVVYAYQLLDICADRDVCPLLFGKQTKCPQFWLNCTREQYSHCMQCHLKIDTERLDSHFMDCRKVVLYYLLANTRCFIALV